MPSWKINNYLPELDLIYSDEIRKMAEYLIDNVLPESTFYVEPSSTRKYHPSCTHKDGGLIIHTKRLIHTARHLARAIAGKDVKKYQELSDIFIVAGICHDMEKAMDYGKDKNKYDHANKAIERIRDYEDRLLEYVDRSTITFVCDLIKTHMGPFEKDAPPMKELSQEQLAFYFADYIASRDLIDMPVDNFKPNLAYDKEFKKEWTYDGSRTKKEKV
jgi:hypothetical protein